MLLLDEPLGALDLKLRRQLQVELKRIQVEVGITFVYVTHDQEEALTMSDRIAVMHAGKVEQLGHARRSSTSGRRPGSWPTSSAPRTCCAVDGRGRRRASGSTSGELAPRRAIDGLAVGHGGRDQRPAGVRSPLVPAERRRRRSAARVEQAAYLGDHRLSTRSARRAGSRLTVLAPKTGIRLPVGSDVAVTWSPSEALVLGERSGRRTEEEPRMTDRHDGSTHRPRAGARSATWPSGG